MKNLFFLLVLGAGLFVTSCSDDDSPEVADFIRATIDGDAFDAVTITAISDTSFGETIVFSVGTTNDFSIGINIPVSVGPSTNIVDEMDFALTFTDAAQNAFFTVGELTITRNDISNNIMEGDFEFVATNDSDSTDVYQVANGGFKVSY